MNDRMQDRVLSSIEMMRLDEWTIQTLGVPAQVLMETAGRAVAQHVGKINPKQRIMEIICFILFSSVFYAKFVAH